MGRVIEEIGDDLALTPGDLTASSRMAPAVLRRCWAGYERHWARFCGARLDPQFWRLENPARWAGRPVSRDGAPVVIVGTGPSLESALPALRRLRSSVHLFTSPRGAAQLEELGLEPDLVLIEHPTPIDAHFTARSLSDRPHRWRQRATLIAIDAHPAPALVDGISDDRLLVLEPLPSWGVWPATAAAIALSSGARAVGIAGIDLGTTDAPDPRQRPLIDLLETLAASGEVPCFDFGHGARKTGWRSACPEEVLTVGPRARLETERHAWSSLSQRLRIAAAHRQRVAPLISAAKSALEHAVRVRDGVDCDVGALGEQLTTLLNWGSDRAIRAAVQDGLGCGFLPRYWRTPPLLTLEDALWRPVALCAQELVLQFDHLGERLRAHGAL